MNVVLMSGALCAPVFGGGVSAVHGLDDLVTRIGSGNIPTGQGVAIGQIEAESDGNYRPDSGHADFIGKTFNLMSGSSGISNHATNVGRRAYGTSSIGLAPEVNTIYVYSAAGWVQSDFLKVGTGSNPLTPPTNLSIMNHSWIGAFDNASIDAQALRRGDWSIDTHQLMFVNGVANSGEHSPLMSFGFNCVSVGMANGTHTAGEIPAGYDSSGSQIPLIVADQNTTSDATGLVSAVTALLIETAKTHINTVDNPLATNSETIKMALLTGGNHAPDWTNNPIVSGVNRGRTNQPIDAIFGVGTVHVDRSWQVLSGGQHASSTASINLTTAPTAGWETELLGSGRRRYLKFTVLEMAEEVSIVITWNQKTNSGFGSYELADFDLELLQLQNEQLASLVGDAGLGVFESGNIVSESEIDNVEHLYIKNLAPGDYVLQIQRSDLNIGNRMFSVGWLFPEQDENLPGDVDGNGLVDVTDLIIIISNWGSCKGVCPADVNGDGVVDVIDILLVITNWSP